jgi:hypothetical protein
MEISEGERESVAARLDRYSLRDALLFRRSRRFGKGMRLNGGPLAYASTHAPQPLQREEEAALAFAACGITGYALGDLPYQEGDVPGAGGGNIMIHAVARTVPTGDAAHTNSVFVLNDQGVWWLRRPQDYPRTEIASLVQAARDHQLVSLYERSRVQLGTHRPDVPREVPFMLSFNQWSANVPGTTTFLPVAELTALTINVLLAAFSEELGYYILDDRNNFQPAGIGKFARSRGGHLYDNPADGRTVTIGISETWLYEFAAIEQGCIIQNLALMTTALGLGGYPYFAAHPFSWMQALGFRMTTLPFSRTIGANPLMKTLLTLLKRDITVPTAVGLEHNGEILIKPFCPPYYSTMREAVLAFVEYKWGEQRGTLRDPTATGWRDGATVQADIPRPSDRTIEATCAYCEYVYGRYGRFPPGSGPFRTVLAYQAHSLDPEFYPRFYRSDAYL